MIDDGAGHAIDEQGGRRPRVRRVIVTAAASRRAWQVVRAAVWLLLAATLPATARADELRFVPVRDGIHALIGDLDARSAANDALNANFGLVVTAEGALLIDSGASRIGAARLHEAIRRVTGQPVRWVVNTGGQDHRWLGNGYFRELGAQIIAHRAAVADMRARARGQLAALAPVLGERLAGTEAVFPDQVLSGADNAITVGGVRIEFMHRGGGHTPGDMLVWLPASRVLFAGDTVYVDRMLGLNEVSNSRAWLHSFEQIEALQPAVIVPGHGGVTDLPTARGHTGDLLRSLRRHARLMIDQGTDLATAVRSFDGSAFTHLRHADVWLPQLVNRTYLEMELE